jgi:hypothetical protein
MPHVICGDCHHKFSDACYFTQHLNTKKNGACKYASFHKKPRLTGPGGLSIPIRIDTAKQKAISEGQAALDAIMEDDSVFEFHDSSSSSESDHELLTNGASVGNKNFYDIDENKADKEEENTANNQTVGLKRFYAYVAKAALDHVELTPEMKAAVEMMHMINAKDGSLELYDEVFKWHMKHHKTVSSVPHKKNTCCVVKKIKS